MERLNYDGLVEQWKVDLIVGRAKCMGFRNDEIPDVQQEIILDVLEFQYDPNKSNGAKERTVLQALIDNRLRHIRRTAMREKAKVERIKDQVRQTCDNAEQQCALDVQDVVADLTPREQVVCRALAEGRSKHEIAKQMGCGWHTVDRLVRHIRDHFEKIGLDGWIGQ
jgi:RNA polymerase sigma factor (sigma-70 family)